MNQLFIVDSESIIDYKEPKEAEVNVQRRRKHSSLASEQNGLGR